MGVLKKIWFGHSASWNEASLQVYPLAVVIVIYLTWIVAGLSLGRQPVPYIDDPKFLGPPIGFVRFLGLLLCLALPLAVKGAYHKLVEYITWEQYIRLAICVLLWCAAIFVLLYDPFDAFKWFLD